MLVFGPKKLPEIGKSLGKGLAEFKKASDDLKKTIEDEIEQGKQEAAAVKEQVAEVRSTIAAAALPPPRPWRASEASVPRAEPAAADSSRLSGFNPRDLLEGRTGQPAASRARTSFPGWGSSSTSRSSASA